MGTYVFDQAWHRERERLSALESLFDGPSRRLLADLGVGEGWRCLEVGCGAGSLALWMADRVGATGRVLATDLDTRFLDGHGRDNLDVRTHNVVTDPLEEEAFDLVHARAVLVHIPDRRQVLKQLVAALRPGGWLLIEDVDFGGATASTLGQYVTAPQPAPAATERVYRAAAALFDAIGADPSYGSRLPATLAGAGLARVGAELHTPVVAGGTEEWVRGTFEQLADRMVGTGLTTAADIELFLSASADPGTFYLPPLMISAWGQRPER
ncbi:MAG TPA: methyltransferase domain-containing protein [Micromonosporaceae bacterium]|nr:methyltransferase domain-containing protein [Micromonosporaceae bacterium]